MVEQLENYPNVGGNIRVDVGNKVEEEEAV